MMFQDLSPERQRALIAHFQSEFGLTETEARDECIAQNGDNLAIHIDACENGYI